MRDYVLYLVAFAAGAAAGYFAKDLIEKKKSESIEEPEEESEDESEEKEEKEEDLREKYKEMTSVYSGPQEEEKSSYHYISDEEYYNAKHRDSLIFYSQDGKLARDSDNKLVGEETIGAEALDRYHNGYADDLYILNEEVGVAYWVTYSDHSYTEDVLNSD